MTDLNTPLLADLVKISFSSDGRVAVFEAEGIGFDPILGQCSSSFVKSEELSFI
jgi:hypothetical protein